MVHIYILQLEQGKYYVGKTNNPYFRLEQHFNAHGSAWTQKYKPIHLEKIIDDCDDFDEDKWTLKYMTKYGIDNVRGGSFCKIILDKENKNIIQKMIMGSTDKCYICGEKGHFAKDCDKKNNDNKYKCNYCDKTFTTQNGARYHEIKWCKTKRMQKVKNLSNRGKKWTNCEEQNLIELLKMGFDCKAIGFTLDRSTTSIRKRITKIYYRNSEFDYNHIITKYNILDKFDRMAVKKYCDYHNKYTTSNDIKFEESTPSLEINEITKSKPHVTKSKKMMILSVL